MMSARYNLLRKMDNKSKRRKKPEQKINESDDRENMSFRAHLEARGIREGSENSAPNYIVKLNDNPKKTKLYIKRYKNNTIQKLTKQIERQ